MRREDIAFPLKSNATATLKSQQLSASKDWKAELQGLSEY
jgi:hypothetical protein